jgi:hypothetical protein
VAGNRPASYFDEREFLPPKGAKTPFQHIAWLTKCGQLNHRAWRQAAGSACRHAILFRCGSAMTFQIFLV